MYLVPADLTQYLTALFAAVIAFNINDHPNKITIHRQTPFFFNTCLAVFDSYEVKMVRDMEIV